MFQSINPFNQQVIFEKEFESNVSLEEKIIKTKIAFDSWKQTSFIERRKYITNISIKLRENKNVYAETISNEMGKNINEALAEIEKCAQVCEFYASNAEDLLNKYQKNLSTETYNIEIQPHGAVLAVMPWNFPFWQVFRYAIPNLMLGNVCLLKHAPNVGMCALALENLFANENHKNIFQVLWADISQLELVVSKPIVIGSTLTGSEKAGASFAALSGKYLKKSVLELGGSDAFIVNDDYNTIEAVKMAIKGRLQNMGQTCIAAKRFIVHQNIYDEFVENLIEELGEVKIGNPLDKENSYGVIARNDLKVKLLEQVTKAQKTGNKIWGFDGKLNRPIIIEVINLEYWQEQDEIFGPVFSIIPFKNEEEAIYLANNTKYGLSASVWTHNIGFIDKTSKMLNCGSVFYNELPKSDFEAPFGGTKSSGYGRELSVLGMLEFANMKTIRKYEKP